MFNDALKDTAIVDFTIVPRRTYMNSRLSVRKHLEQMKNMNVNYFDNLQTNSNMSPDLAHFIHFADEYEHIKIEELTDRYHEEQRERRRAVNGEKRKKSTGSSKRRPSRRVRRAEGRRMGYRMLPNIIESLKRDRQTTDC